MSLSDPKRWIASGLLLVGLSGAAGLCGADQGESIRTLHSGTAHEALYGLCLQGDKGLAVGASGLLLHSKDGGENWEESPGFTRSALLDIDCTAASNLLVGQGGAIFRMEDGSVRQLPSGTESRLMSVARSMEGDIAFAVGAFGAIQRSMDGGLNWESISLDWFELLNDYIEPHLYDVHVASSGAITIVGEFSLVLQSEDWGDTWTKRHQEEASLFAVNIDASGFGFAVGQEGVVVRTVDHGVTWQREAAPIDDSLISIFIAGPQQVVAAGIRNFLYSSNAGRSWTILNDPAVTTGWYQGLQASIDAQTGELDVILAGHRANILKVQLPKNN